VFFNVLLKYSHTSFVFFYLKGLRDRVAVDLGSGRGLVGDGLPASGYDQRHFQVHPESEQQGRELDGGRQRR